MKLHLEPLAIAANVTQAAFCRLDTVLLTFGFLVMQYQQMTGEADHAASKSIISSLEKRWMAADQDIFVATVIVNPFFRADPFGRHPRFVVAGIIELLGRLYTRFFFEEPPHIFNVESRDYLTVAGQYSELRATCLRHKATAQQQVRFSFASLPCQRTYMDLQDTPLDPLEVYRNLSFSSEPHSPFHRLAARLLSVSANSATCERLFSVFGNTLTKLRNRMGTSTLSSIAELKMHVRNEHHLNSTKTQMKRMFTTRSKTTHSDEPPVQQTIAQPPSPWPASPTSNDAPISSTDGDLNHVHCPRPGFRDFISDRCDIGPIEDDEPVACPPSGGKLSLSQLFNFENRHWATLYEECAKRSYEEELALYDLLNEDAATGDGLEVDVDETTADILIG